MLFTFLGYTSYLFLLVTSCIGFSDEGIPGAYLLMGKLYMKGIGGKKNMKEAIRYYKKAAALGNEEAKKELSDRKIKFDTRGSNT
jgi:TPR repeat protein